MKKNIKYIFLIQGITTYFFSIVYAIKGDDNKWFSRIALSMVLLGIFAIIKTIEDK